MKFILFFFFENHEAKGFFCKSTDSLKFDMKVILQENSVKNACRQMQTLWDLNLSSMSMFGLFSKIYQFLAKLNF